MTAGTEGYTAIRKPEPPDQGREWVLLRCRVRCEEPMELAARFGYDGPLAVRVDGIEAAYDPYGPRRPMPDTLSVPISAGRGTFTVIAALGSGVRTTTGVSLRFERTDLTQSAVIAGPGAYRLPIVE